MSGQKRVPRRNGRKQLSNGHEANAARQRRSNLQAANRSKAPVARIVKETKASDVSLPDNIVAVEAERLGIEGMKENQLITRSDNEPKHRRHTRGAMNLH